MKNVYTTETYYKKKKQNYLVGLKSAKSLDLRFPVWGQQILDFPYEDSELYYIYVTWFGNKSCYISYC